MSSAKEPAVKRKYVVALTEPEREQLTRMIGPGRAGTRPGDWPTPACCSSAARGCRTAA